MPNGTYGGVRGRETKVIGGKLQESFVFLLLDCIFTRKTQCYAPLVSYRHSIITLSVFYIS